MKMHSQRLRDPMIGAAHPITVLGPLVEESLRLARIRPDREKILERFMSGQPRLAVVHGSEDHPAAIGSRDQVRRVMRELWLAGALPLEVSLAVPSEELARGRPGAHYAFLSRNVCAASLSSLVEAHGYDAAFVLGACDKMLVGSLRALIEADLSRQQRRLRPLYAAFIPTTVGPPVTIDEEGRRRFERMREKLPEPERDGVFALLERPIDAMVYERVKAYLDEAFRRRAILESEKDELEYAVACRVFLPGAGCASSSASVVTRLMIASFGLVPRQMDLSLEAPDDEHIAQAVARILHGIDRRERKISVSQLVRANLQNGVSIWAATGGDPSWLLHLHYLAQGVGGRISPAALGRKTARVPCVLDFDGDDGGSPHGMAAESDNGGNSGIDTLMRTLSEKRFIDDRAQTLDGAWMHRIMDARSANGRYFRSTITPVAPSCGVSRVEGNLATEAIARVARNLEVDLYDEKVYLADYYLGCEELNRVLERPDGMLERIRKKVTAEDLFQTWSVNWASSGVPDGIESWDKKRLWSYLVENELLRVVLFVAGEGPRAAGMRRLSCPLTISEGVNGMCILATDGRIGFGYAGLSVSQIVPEALEGGGLSAVRPGDWVQLSLRRGEFHVVRPTRRTPGFRPLRNRELVSREEVRKRTSELTRRRNALLPSVRAVFDTVSSAAEGLSPLRPERRSHELTPRG